MAKRKTAREKLEEAKGLPKVVATPKGVMLVPKPLDVDACIRKVKKGRLVTVKQVRDRLARDSKADFTCPLTTGIFLRISAEASEEDIISGREPAPYWRVVKQEGSLNEKFPGGAEHQAVHLREEGHTIIPGKGKKPPKVANFEQYREEI